MRTRTEKQFLRISTFFSGKNNVSFSQQDINKNSNKDNNNDNDYDDDHEDANDRRKNNDARAKFRHPGVFSSVLKMVRLSKQTKASLQVRERKRERKRLKGKYR